MVVVWFGCGCILFICTQCWLTQITVLFTTMPFISSVTFLLPCTTLSIGTCSFRQHTWTSYFRYHPPFSPPSHTISAIYSNLTIRPLQSLIDHIHIISRLHLDFWTSPSFLAVSDDPESYTYNDHG
jgi:hypothetical protein